MSVLPPPPAFDVEDTLTSQGLLAREFTQSSTSLPAYTVPETPPTGATRQQTEHVVALTISEKNTHEWLKLKVKSWAAPKHLPSFVEGTPITGSVELDLRKYDNIKAIAISVSSDRETLESLLLMNDLTIAQGFGCFLWN